MMTDNYDPLGIVITMLQGCASTVLLGVVPSCCVISIDGQPCARAAYMLSVLAFKFDSAVVGIPRWQRICWRLDSASKCLLLALV